LKWNRDPKAGSKSRVPGRDRDGIRIENFYFGRDRDEIGIKIEKLVGTGKGSVFDRDPGKNTNRDRTGTRSKTLPV
jgi:hypothetical protein